MPARVQPSDTWRRIAVPPWRFLLGGAPWRALAYLVLSAAVAVLFAPLAIATFLIIPLWGILLGALERHRGRMLGFPAVPSGHVPVPREERGHWLGIRMTEAATWRETTVLLVDIVAGAAAVVLLFFQAVFLVVPVGLAVIASGEEREVTVFGDLGLRVGPENWWAPLLLVPPLLAVYAYTNALLALGQASLVHWILAPRGDELEQRIAQLARSRAAIVAAHEEERRRMERDLHDGAQQELVGVAAALGVLELELISLDADTAGARSALDLARARTEQALASLRATVHGIRPAVLADRGLSAAIEELAVRAPLPAEFRGGELERLDPAVESAAYFFVAEAITNAAKHSGAERVVITASGGERVRIDVADDGRGGADPARGTGLIGLRERIDAVGGELRISSPAGGPTALSIEVPAGGPARAEEAADANPARR